MFCSNCGATLADNTAVCTNCGAQLQPAAPDPQQSAPYGSPAPVVRYVIPEENRPLSPWAYFGLQLLFAIPIVGFIFLIIFSCNGSNINRRNFARSYWCVLVISVIIGLILFFAYWLSEYAWRYI